MSVVIVHTTAATIVFVLANNIFCNVEKVQDVLLASITTIIKTKESTLRTDSHCSYQINKLTANICL